MMKIQDLQVTTRPELAQMQAIIDQIPDNELRELSDIISRLLTDDLR